MRAALRHGALRDAQLCALESRREIEERVTGLTCYVDRRAPRAQHTPLAHSLLAEAGREPIAQVLVPESGPAICTPPPTPFAAPRRSRACALRASAQHEGGPRRRQGDPARTREHEPQHRGSPACAARHSTLPR